MQTNGRNPVKSSGDGKSTSKRMQETRSLLAQALTRWEAGERREAKQSLAAATKRLSDERQGMPDGEADLLELINIAYNHAFAGNDEVGLWILRNTIQLFDAVELNPDQPLDSPMLGGGRK